MADGALWLPQRLMRLIVRQLLLVEVLFVFLFLKFFQLLNFLFEVVRSRAAAVDETDSPALCIYSRPAACARR